MPKQVSKNVYSIDATPITQAVTQRESLLSRYAQNKYEQFKLSLAEAERQFKTEAEKAKFRQKYFLELRKELAKQASEAEKAANAAMNKDIDSLNAARKYNSSAAQKAAEFNSRVLREQTKTNLTQQYRERQTNLTERDREMRTNLNQQYREMQLAQRDELAEDRAAKGRLGPSPARPSSDLSGELAEDLSHRIDPIRRQNLPDNQEAEAIAAALDEFATMHALNQNQLEEAAENAYDSLRDDFRSAATTDADRVRADEMFLESVPEKWRGKYSERKRKVDTYQAGRKTIFEPAAGEPGVVVTAPAGEGAGGPINPFEQITEEEEARLQEIVYTAFAIHGGAGTPGLNIEPKEAFKRLEVQLQLAVDSGDISKEGMDAAIIAQYMGASSVVIAELSEHPDFTEEDEKELQLQILNSLPRKSREVVINHGVIITEEDIAYAKAIVDRKLGSGYDADAAAATTQPEQAVDVKKPPFPTDSPYQLGRLGSGPAATVDVKESPFPTDSPYQLGREMYVRGVAARSYAPVLRGSEEVGLTQSLRLKQAKAQAQLEGLEAPEYEPKNVLHEAQRTQERTFGRTGLGTEPSASSTRDAEERLIKLFDSKIEAALAQLPPDLNQAQINEVKQRVVARTIAELKGQKEIPGVAMLGADEPAATEFIPSREDKRAALALRNVAQAVETMGMLPYEQQVEVVNGSSQYLTEALRGIDAEQLSPRVIRAIADTYKNLKLPEGKDAQVLSNPMFAAEERIKQEASGIIRLPPHSRAGYAASVSSRIDTELAGLNQMLASNPEEKEAIMQSATSLIQLREEMNRQSEQTIEAPKPEQFQAEFISRLTPKEKRGELSGMRADIKEVRKEGRRVAADDLDTTNLELMFGRTTYTTDTPAIKNTRYKINRTKNAMKYYNSLKRDPTLLNDLNSSEIGQSVNALFTDYTNQGPSGPGFSELYNTVVSEYDNTKERDQAVELLILNKIAYDKSIAPEDE